MHGMIGHKELLTTWHQNDMQWNNYVTACSLRSHFFEAWGGSLSWKKCHCNFAACFSSILLCCTYLPPQFSTTSEYLMLSKSSCCSNIATPVILTATCWLVHHGLVQWCRLLDMKSILKNITNMQCKLFLFISLEMNETNYFFPLSTFTSSGISQLELLVQNTNKGRLNMMDSLYRLLV